MNWTRFFIAFVAAFVFIFFFGFLWFGLLMHPIHNEVPALWRPEAEFGSHFAWLVAGHAVMAFFLAMLCARFVATGAGAAAVLGVLVGLLCAGGNLITFAVQPITTKILGGWIVGGVIQFALAGAIIGAIYRPRVSIT